MKRKGEEEIEDDGSENDGRVSPKKRLREEDRSSRVKKDLEALIARRDKNESWNGHWCFCQLADTQLGMMNRDDWSVELKTARMAVDAINKLKPRPKFVIVCGDLVDSYPNGPRANKKMHDQQNIDFQNVMGRISSDISLVCVCGNHDVGDRITKVTETSWREMYGPSHGAFSISGCRCILLNSSLLAAKDPLLWKRGFFPHLDGVEDKDFDAKLDRLGVEARIMAKAQDEWLDREFASESIRKHKHVLVFSHIPPFLYRSNEPKGYFNLEPSIRKDVLNKLKRAGATHWFCGHFHRNAGGRDESLEVVVTRAVGCVLPYAKNVLENTSKAEQGALGLCGLDFKRRRCDPDVSGFRLVSVKDDSVLHRFVTLNEIQNYIAHNDRNVEKIVGSGDQVAKLSRVMEQNLILSEK